MRVGTDVIEIERIRRAVARFGSHFLDRLFTPAEQRYALAHSDPAPRLAGRFAAKEAVFKALRPSFPVLWKEIEIVAGQAGGPEVVLSERLRSRETVALSISHCREYAVATAIVY